MDTQISQMQEKMKLAEAHKYVKWSCGYIGPNIPVNTTNTPVFGTKAQGGIGGMFGGTKTFLSHYNTTYSCGNCGGTPSNHSSREMIKLGTDVESLFVQTYNDLKNSVNLMDHEIQENNKKYNEIDEALKQIDIHLNQLSSLKRNYVDDLKAQIM